MIRRITPFLSTRDLAATVHFYTELLGFEIEVLHPADAPTMCILDHGACSLIFDASLWDGTPAMTGQIHIEVDDATAYFERLRDHAPILWGPEVYHYGRREFACRDPNGYSLMFSELTDDAPTTEGEAPAC